MQIPFDEIRRWMFDRALPLWANNGVDSLGGFVEALDFKDNRLRYRSNAPA